MTTKTTAKPKRIGLSLTGVSVEFKNEYDDLAKKHNMTHTEFAGVLLESYKQFHIDLTDEEADIINQAILITPITYKKKIKKAILRSAANIISSNTTDNNVDTDKINSIKAANKRADILLESMFKHNDTVTNKYDKIFISKSSFLEFINKAKEKGQIKIAASKLVANRCLERHNSQIKEHHLKHELNTNHNLKAHYERLKQPQITKKGKK